MAKIASIIFHHEALFDLGLLVVRKSAQENNIEALEQTKEVSA